MEGKKVDYIAAHDALTEIKSMIEQAFLMAQDMDSDLFALDEEDEKSHYTIAWCLTNARTRNDIILWRLSDSIRRIDEAREEFKTA